MCDRWKRRRGDGRASRSISRLVDMEADSVLRRSLRRINPFRNKLFRLPATPRLSRNRKIRNGEDVVTEWNFERASFRSIGKGANEFISGGLDFSSVDTISLPGNSKRPPNSVEAELNIHTHMQSLLLSTRKSQFLQLPNTRYGANGEISNAYWSKDVNYDLSPNQSTISLLNPHNRYTWDNKYNKNGTAMSHTSSFRPTYPLNGIRKVASTEPIETGTVSPNLHITPLFNLDNFYSINDLEETFIGREWVFREIYQSSIVEKVPITIIQGASGAGKSSILNQLILNSSFYPVQASDTLDSGCVPDSGSSLSCRNYEWLRAVSARLVAHHICNIQSASSCSIPEFICNLGALLAKSPVLKSYADILTKHSDLQSLLNVNNCLKHNSLDVFKKTIAEPLGQLKSSDQGSLVIVIDGLDEAEFHRSENGRSIATFLCSIIPLLPSWIRFVVACDENTSNILDEITVRRIRIDDASLDERVLRDNRMLVEYRISMLEDTVIFLRRQSIVDRLNEISDQIVYNSQGNMLYIRLVLRLIETGKLSLMSVTTAALPKDISELYNMDMDLTFTSMSSFQRVSAVLNILLASLRPLDRTTLYNILNSIHPGTTMPEMELNEILTILSPLLSFSSSGDVCLHHSALRNWLLKNGTNGKYHGDARNGHILLALHLTHRSPLNSNELFELAHHLLKAHPYKYMNGEYIPELTSSKDGQILWIQKSSCDITTSLLNLRNMHYPNTKISRLLLLAGADPNSVDTDGTVAQQACAAGHWELLSLLLQHGAQVHPKLGSSLLTIAAKNGHLHLVHMLHPMDGMRSISAAVIDAAQEGHLQILSFLLGCKWPNSELRAKSLEDAVTAAAGAGHTPICQYLVDSFASMDINRAMNIACEKGQADTVQFFLSRGASLSSFRWPPDRPALHCAVESGSWDLVVAVLSVEESDVNQVDSYGRTPIIVAAKCGHVGLIDMFINKGADINHHDAHGWSALMYAVQKDHFQSVQLLLERNAKIDGQEQSGCSVAHIACSSATRNTIDRLIEAGMPIEEKDKDGLRPIELAIKAKNRSALETLLKRGARLRSSTWKTALEHDPEKLFILLSKLLDDAGILFRKKRLEDAMHRLHYALNKCEGYIADDNLQVLRPRFMRLKMQILLAAARIHRKESRLDRAVDMCSEAATHADTEDLLFEVLLLRAKCHFDRHDVDKARSDVRAATQLRPGDDEAKHLLNTLSLPNTNTSKL